MDFPKAGSVSTFCGPPAKPGGSLLTGSQGPVLKVVVSKRKPLNSPCVENVVLLATSHQDLQDVLKQFTAKCELTGIRISSYMSVYERPWFSTGKRWTAACR
ncbi:hypothetical protein AMECASPLE_033914 [Ameca splendens]|uniref:Uncharacterized protein n=1 Tax=Ameca splendens TaxID=208324 RepID=A0ABV1A3D0_9TELE